MNKIVIGKLYSVLLLLLFCFEFFCLFVLFSLFIFSLWVYLMYVKIPWKKKSCSVISGLYGSIILWCPGLIHLKIISISIVLFHAENREGLTTEHKWLYVTIIVTKHKHVTIPFCKRNQHFVFSLCSYCTTLLLQGNFLGLKSHKGQ